MTVWLGSGGRRQPSSVLGIPQSSRDCDIIQEGIMRFQCWLPMSFGIDMTISCAYYPQQTRFLKDSRLVVFTPVSLTFSTGP